MRSSQTQTPSHSQAASPTLTYQTTTNLALEEDLTWSRVIGDSDEEYDLLSELLEQQGVTIHQPIIMKG
jgi:hypothetical protein